MNTIKISIEITVPDGATISLSQEEKATVDMTKKVAEVFKGKVVKEEVAPKKKGNFSGAIAAISKAATAQELDEIQELIGQRLWSGNEQQVLLSALEEKRKSI